MFHLFGLMCVGGPILAGWYVGRPVSTAALLAGLVMGFVLGAMSGFGFRGSLAWIDRRWGRTVDALPEVWRIASLVGSEIAAVAWVLGSSYVAFLFIRFAVRHVAA